jgi:hypothetical protein
MNRKILPILSLTDNPVISWELGTNELLIRQNHVSVIKFLINTLTHLNSDIRSRRHIFTSQGSRFST